jgi:hypothetical protein
MKLRELLGLPSCVRQMTGYQVLKELLLILALVLLFSLPAIIW